MSVSSPILGQTEATVKNALAQFIKKHTGEDALSAIDEIVLSYVVSIVDSLSSGLESPEDSFDADLFAEMIVAYIPSFGSINSAAVCEWMIDLCCSIKKTKTNKVKREVHMRLPYESTTKEITTFPDPIKDTPLLEQGSKRCRSLSTSSDERLSSKSNVEQQQHQFPPVLSKNQHLQRGLEILSEMFPHLTMTDLQRALSIAAGDCQKAVQLLLLRKHEGSLEETSSSSCLVNSPPWAPRNRTTSNDSNLEEDFLQQDKHLREHILNKYAYIDQDDDVREHRPVAPKSEPKKLIRYRDNKIVSIKGERYSEVKSEEGDELKKTFVSLKPARQYRFH